MPLEPAVGAGAPFALQVELTSRCNLKCTMCPLTSGATASSVNPGLIGERSWSEVTKLAKQTRFVVVAGFGEPLADPRCFAMLEELDREGIGFDVTTNGTPLTPANVARLATFEHLRRIHVSIDSPDPDTYLAIRGGPLDRAVAGLRTLMGAMEDPYRVCVQAVLTPETAPTLPHFPGLLSTLGVRTLVIQGLVDYSGNPELPWRLPPEAKNYVQAIREAGSAEGVDVSFTVPGRLDLELNAPEQVLDLYDGASAGRRTRQCMLPWEMPYVDKNGSVFACCYAAANDGRVLAELENTSLEAAWNGAAFRKFRRDLISGSSMPAECRTCTTVPLGPHPLDGYSAAIDLRASRLRGTDNRLVVRNAGSEVWGPDTHLRIGTAQPRDRRSQLYHPTWLSEDRVASFAEEEVRPGATATFLFSTESEDVRSPETFQLVVEGRFWLPGTEFKVDPRSWMDRLRHALALPARDS